MMVVSGVANYRERALSSSPSFLAPSSFHIWGNVYFCCSTCGVLLNDNAFITKDFVRSYVQHAQSLDVIRTVRCLLEVFYVRHGYSSLGRSF